MGIESEYPKPKGHNNPATKQSKKHPITVLYDIIIIIIEGLSLLQSIPPTTADKQTQAQNCMIYIL